MEEHVTSTFLCTACRLVFVDISNQGQLSSRLPGYLGHFLRLAYLMPNSSDSEKDIIPVQIEWLTVTSRPHATDKINIVLLYYNDNNSSIINIISDFTNVYSITFSH